MFILGSGHMTVIRVAENGRNSVEFSQAVNSVGDSDLLKESLGRAVTCGFVFG
jgi:hypothetical protein